MSITEKRLRHVALIGNPNTGKTTVFNALTGFKARVGNYAGVTVERKTGPLKGSGGAVILVDLPGTYSLTARSADEMVATDVLLGHRTDEPRPDAVLVVADATNLERNLFLATQVIECGLPCAIVLNMMDAAEKAALRLDTDALSRRLGVPVFPVAAVREQGLEPVQAFLRQDEFPRPPDPLVDFPEGFQEAVAALRTALEQAGVPAEHREDFLLRRALLDPEGMAARRLVEHGGTAATAAIQAGRDHATQHGLRLASLEARARYGAIREALSGLLEKPETTGTTTTDRLDALLIHRIWGTVIFALLMMIVFQAIYSWSGPLMELIDGAFGALGGMIAANMAEGPLQSFLVDGVIAGVGGVLIFLPQILILFLFIAVLEDCGYIARAAFLMDRLLSRVGLSGRSFIPMLSSFACAIPGIMATRTIEDRRDRLTTILVAPLMSCSARLPVYVLLIGAFVPERTVAGVIGLQGLVLFAMYLVGLGVAIPVALILKKTLLKGATPSFIMELPPYRTPSWKNVLHRLVERAGAFVKRAGTIIFAVAILIWALTYYPRPDSVAEAVEEEYAPLVAEAQAAGAEERVEELLAELDRETAGAYLRQSFLGRAGQLIEPIVRPLGWDWKIGMATLASFPAREIIVATLGVIYDLGGETDEESADLREKLRQARHPDGTPVFTLPVALGIMVFFALCAQCAATLAVIRRETNSWRWPAFSFTYMTVLAYIGAFITYWGARMIL